MTRERLFNTWAPADAIWSSWAKPVLFAHARSAMPAVQAPIFPLEQVAAIPLADQKTIIVIDLPGASSVALGAVFAERGYCPVPLFNAIPSPSGTILGTNAAAVDVFSIIATLIAATSRLKELQLPPDAPPSFLLDANRRIGSGTSIQPGMFDNRSISLATDFPSANLLLSRGISRVVLIQENVLQPQSDLAHTLLRWQQAGLQILAATTESNSIPVPIRVARPRFYRMIWHRLLATMNLRPNPLGGFGGMLPIPHSGSVG